MAARELERGRMSYAARRWQEAYDALSKADAVSPLEPEDLEALAMSAALTGRDRELLANLERLYKAHVEAGRDAEAAWAAFLIGFRLISFGEIGRAGGWFGRAERAVDACEDGDCVVRGWLMLPAIHRHLMAGDDAAAHDAAVDAATVGERHDDRDLIAFARNLQGRALLRSGRLVEGLALLDEVLVEAASDELSPLITGLVYCSVIATCHQVYALDRAREWTSALAQWCDRQPQLVTFTGSCLVHRAEIMQIGGEWREAEQEARRAWERFADADDPEAVGNAFYQQAEIHRLRGEHDEAEEAYRRASEYGCEPQPGLALLRLSQGNRDAAAAALRRVVGATKAPFARARYLPALVEIALASGNVGEARRAAGELQTIAQELGTEVIAAMASHAQGAVRLANGDAQTAIEPLRRAFRVWQQIGAPYIVARIRVLLAQACRVLGDEDGFRLELHAARKCFAELGASPDLARLDVIESARQERFAGGTHGLTPREIEVLRQVARGCRNKAIAEQLCVSERTIDRHVSNIFTKLDVRSRAAATAFAYEHGLV